MRGACETAPVCAQARFGHCIAKCEQTLYMYGGRTMGGAIESFMQFDARPLVWRSVPAAEEARAPGQTPAPSPAPPGQPKYDENQLHEFYMLTTTRNAEAKRGNPWT